MAHGKIPKIIHHTWPSGGTFKERFRTYRESWMKYNPDYTFMFWTRDDAPGYALSEDSAFVQSEAYGLHYIVVSDIMRPEILYKYGGIYVDCDVECLRSFDCFLDDMFFCGVSYPPNNCGNAVVGVVPGHPAIKEWGEYCLDIIHQHEIEFLNVRPDTTLGVNFAGNFLEKHALVKYPLEYFYPFSWGEAEKYKKSAPTINGTPVACTMFPDSYAIHWWSGMDDDGWVHDRNVKLEKLSESLYG